MNVLAIETSCDSSYANQLSPKAADWQRASEGENTTFNTIVTLESV